jgi:hypothetical protein
MNDFETLAAESLNEGAGGVEYTFATLLYVQLRKM